MKKVLVILMLAMGLTAADVQLICNANPPEQQVTHYGFWERADGTNWTLIGTTPDATNGVKFQRPFGKYTWSATAFNSAGMSDYAMPIEFELRDDGVTLKRPTSPVQLAAIIDPWTLFPGASAGGNPEFPNTNNLIAFYKADESSGDMADAWTSGLTFTNNGGTFATSGGVISGAATNASSSTSPAFQRTKFSSSFEGNWTVSAWFMTSSGTQTNGVACWADSFANRQWMMRIEGAATNPQVRVYISDNGNLKKNWITTSGMGRNGWNHAAFTVNGATLKIYTNGVECTDLTKTTDSAITGITGSSGSGATVGAYSGGGNSHTAGTAADLIGIWRAALSATSISNLYNGGAGLQP